MTGLGQSGISNRLPLIEVKFPSNPKWLEGLRGVVSFICEQNDLTEDEIAGVILAVDEACANIIVHGYRGQPDRPIVFRHLSYDGCLEFQLEDEAPTVDRSKIKSRPLDEIRPGGLGVHFINSAMDEVIFDSVNGAGNLLRLIKYKEAPSKAREE